MQSKSCGMRAQLKGPGRFFLHDLPLGPISPTTQDDDLCQAAKIETWSGDGPFLLPSRKAAPLPIDSLGSWCRQRFTVYPCSRNALFGSSRQLEIMCPVKLLFTSNEHAAVRLSFPTGSGRAASPPLYRHSNWKVWAAAYVLHPPLQWGSGHCQLCT